MAQNKPETLIVHHTKVSRDKNPRQFDAVDRYHRDQWNGQTKSSLGFYGGYHYLIEPDGTVGRYRNDNEVGAHCKEQSMNFRSLGICLTGDFDVETPTVAQQNALRTLLREKMAQYSITRENIVPHRFYASYKSCFGANLPDDWARRLVAEPNDTMKWVIDSQKNQWLISDSPVKIAVSIPDETALKELLANGLQGTPEAVANLDGYVLYRGASEQSWRAFLNL